MTTMAVQEFLQQHAVRCVLAQFVDIHGTAKAKAVPVEHLGMVLGNGAGFAGFPMWEWIEYARHVSDWETDRYLEFF